MRHTQHRSNNSVLAAPPGTTYEQCTALPITRVQYADGANCCVSFWEPTDEERTAIANGAKVALSVWGVTTGRPGRRRTRLGQRLVTE